MEPEELDDQRFAQLFAEAVYVKQMEAELIADSIMKRLNNVL